MVGVPKPTKIIPPKHVSVEAAEHAQMKGARGNVIDEDDNKEEGVEEKKEENARVASYEAVAKT